MPRMVSSTGIKIRTSLWIVSTKQFSDNDVICQSLGSHVEQGVCVIKTLFVQMNQSLNFQISNVFSCEIPRIQLLHQITNIKQK
jgi:hypothetical protein